MPDAETNPTLERLDQIAVLLRELVAKDGRCPSRLLSVKDAADYLSVGPKKIRSLIQAGELPFVRNGESSAGKWLLDVSDLNEWIERAKINL